MYVFYNTTIPAHRYRHMGTCTTYDRCCYSHHPSSHTTRVDEHESKQQISEQLGHVTLSIPKNNA